MFNKFFCNTLEAPVINLDVGIQNVLEVRAGTTIKLRAAFHGTPAPEVCSN